jgi:hypothetical protein
MRCNFGAFTMIKTLHCPPQLEVYQQLLDDFIQNDPNTATLRQVITHENHWSPNYAQRVIEEYKKMLLIAAATQIPLTPSKDVDKVWHTHLLQTKSYWQMCEKVFNMPIHHQLPQGDQPLAQTQADAKKTYQQTLTRYRDVLGELPPSDIWPPLDHANAPKTQLLELRTRHQNTAPKIRKIASITLLSLFGVSIVGALFLFFQQGRMSTVSTEPGIERSTASPTPPPNPPLIAPQPQAPQAVPPSEAIAVAPAGVEAVANAVGPIAEESQASWVEIWSPVLFWLVIFIGTSALNQSSGSYGYCHSDY